MIVINDQGGKSIAIERSSISPTLRAQDHGHPPLVFSDKNSAYMCMGVDDRIAPTLRITSIPSVLVND